MSRYGEIDTKYYNMNSINNNHNHNLSNNYLISAYFVSGGNHYLIDNCYNFYKAYDSYGSRQYRLENSFSSKKLNNSEIDFIKSISPGEYSLLSTLLKFNNKIEFLESNNQKQEKDINEKISPELIKLSNRIDILELKNSNDTKVENDFMEEIKSLYDSNSKSEKDNEIDTLKNDMKSLIGSMNNLKEYCMELQKIGDEQQKILEEVCKEVRDLRTSDSELKKRISHLEESSSKTKKFIPELPILPTFSELIKKNENKIPELPPLPTKKKESPVEATPVIVKKQATINWVSNSNNTHLFSKDEELKYMLFELLKDTHTVVVIGKLPFQTSQDMTNNYLKLLSPLSENEQKMISEIFSISYKDYTKITT
jgi:hypothetical protein